MFPDCLAVQLDKPLQAADTELPAALSLCPIHKGLPAIPATNPPTPST